VDLESLIELITGRHHDENIHIAIGVRPTVGVGSEQDDLVRLEPFRHLACEAADHPQGNVGAPVPGLDF